MSCDDDLRSRGRSGSTERGTGVMARRGALALAASLAIVLALPLTSLADGLPDVGGGVNSALQLVPSLTSAVQSTVQGVITPRGSGSGSPSPASSGSAPAQAPSTARTAYRPSRSATYAPSAASSGASTASNNTPAMYGTNPHGQGTVGGVSLSPSATLPYAYSPSGSGGEQVVIGRGRSEQNSGGYHAHTSILDLLGTELLGVDAQPGQSSTGPLNAIQTGILDKLCTGTSMLVCLTVLAADTAATPSGASTHFAIARATVAGAHGLDAGAAESNSAINTAGSCQNASGSSSAAGVNIAGGPLATLAQTSESSTACAGAPSSQQAGSSVIGLGGTGVPLPAPGCANGATNTTLDVLGLLTTLCNADNQTQAATPAGVREALTAIVLPAVNTALAKTVVASSESHAVAPAVLTPSCTSGACKGGGGGGGKSGGKRGGGKRAGKHTQMGPTGASETGTGSGGSTTEEVVLRSTVSAAPDLPFTGDDLLKVVFVGLLLAGGGILVRLRTEPQS